MGEGFTPFVWFVQVIDLTATYRFRSSLRRVVSAIRFLPKSCVSDPPPPPLDSQNLSTDLKNMSPYSKNMSTDSQNLSPYSKNVSRDSKNLSPGSKSVSTDSNVVSPDSRNMSSDSKDVSTDSRIVSSDSRIVSSDSNHMSADSNGLSTDSQVLSRDAKRLNAQACRSAGVSPLRLPANVGVCPAGGEAPGETPALRREAQRPPCDLSRTDTSYIHPQQLKYPAVSASRTASTNK